MGSVLLQNYLRIKNWGYIAPNSGYLDKNVNLKTNEIGARRIKSFQNFF